MLHNRCWGSAYFLPVLECVEVFCKLVHDDVEAANRQIAQMRDASTLTQSKFAIATKCAHFRAAWRILDNLLSADLDPNSPLWARFRSIGGLCVIVCRRAQCERERSAGSDSDSGVQDDVKGSQSGKDLKGDFEEDWNDMWLPGEKSL